MNLLYLLSEVDVVALILGLGFCVFPILVLTFIVCFKFLFKKIKENKETSKKEHYNNPKNGKDYYVYFGGLENIKSIKKELNRATLEIIDMSKVDFTQLKALSIGVLVTGTQLKVSSKEIVDAIKEK